jgi:hypothetical protein
VQTDAVGIVSSVGVGGIGFAEELVEERMPKTKKLEKGPELLASFGPFRLYKNGTLYTIRDTISEQFMEMPLDAICLLQRMLIQGFGLPE